MTNMPLEYNVNDMPNAAAVVVCGCGDDGCGHPHLVLLDKDDKPIAACSLGDGAIEKIANWGKPKKFSAADIAPLLETLDNMSAVGGDDKAYELVTSVVRDLLGILQARVTIPHEGAQALHVPTALSALALAIGHVFASMSPLAKMDFGPQVRGVVNSVSKVDAGDIASLIRQFAEKSRSKDEANKEEGK